MIIKGTKYDWESIEVRVNDVVIDRIISVKYDDFKQTIEFAKHNGININYGIGNLPISVDYPKGMVIDELKMIDLNNVSRKSWFKF